MTYTLSVLKNMMCSHGNFWSRRRCNYIRYSVLDEITSPFRIFNDTGFEDLKEISNVIPPFTEHVISYPC